MKILALAVALAAPATALIAADLPAAHVNTAHVQGSRPLQPQTAQAAVRDYLLAWDSMAQALESNDKGKLDADFTGEARTRLGQTLDAQAAAGIHSRYTDVAHDIQVLFYSPEGLSLELADTVSYTLTLFNQDQPVTSREIHERYIVVLTPAEAQWKTRIFQGD